MWPWQSCRKPGSLEIRSDPHGIPIGSPSDPHRIPTAGRLRVADFWRLSRHHPPSDSVVLALAAAVEYLRGALFELLTADEPSFVEVLL